ncbi:MAG TPA: GTPase Era [Gammaproteobacteria bacterium]|nr:GTPase Era [Gammaproteobacteria bacterium]
MSNEFHCGYVAILGRPNVGKSTLLNHLIGQKISITSRKPQTTRHQILGIKTLESAQILYIDTPGIHKQAHHALNRYMNRVATGAIPGVDVIVFMVDGLQWYEDDDLVLKKIETVDRPVILAVNKIDKIADKTALLPHLEMLSKKRQFAAVVPISAKRQADVMALEQVIVRYLPENPPLFPEDQVTDRSERFLVAEIIREKLMRHLGKELPYALTVEIEQFKQTDKLLRIAAVIYVEKASQKRIVIGEDGELLKAVGTEARLEMEKWLADKIFLQLWVKVKRGWSDDERSLQSLGYGK